MAQKHDPDVYEGIKKIIPKVPCCLFSFMYILNDTILELENRVVVARVWR